MTSTVNCDYTGANWEFNSEGENPCMVYAELQGVCDSSFRIAQVTSTSAPYTPPNNACGCNVVAYNLMGACGWCQSTIQTSWWLTVDQWAGNCTAASYDATGIPDTVATATINIPAWALVAPTGTSWNPSQASNIALPSGASTTSTPSGASTTRGFTFTTPSYSYTGYPYDYPYYDYGTTVNVAAIVCGVIFGLYALVLIAVVAAYFIRQNKRKAWYGPMGRYYAAQRGYGGGQPGYGPPMMGGYAPNQNTAAGVPLLYNPANYNNGTPVPNTAYPNTPSTNYQIPTATGTTSNQSYQPPPPESYTGAPTPVGYQPPPPDQGGMYGGVPNTNSVYGAPPQGPPNTMSMYGTPPPGAGGAAGNPNAAAFKGHAEVY